MNAVEYVLWMAATMELVGKDSLPTPEQWQKMYEKMSVAMGKITSARLLDDAASLADTRRRQQEAYEHVAKAYYANDPKIASGIVGITDTATSLLPQFQKFGTPKAQR